MTISTEIVAAREQIVLLRAEVAKAKDALIEAMREGNQYKSYMDRLIAWMDDPERQRMGQVFGDDARALYCAANRVARLYEEIDGLRDLMSETAETLTRAGKGDER